MAAILDIIIFVFNACLRKRLKAGQLIALRKSHALQETLKAELLTIVLPTTRSINSKNPPCSSMKKFCLNICLMRCCSFDWIGASWRYFSRIPMKKTAIKSSPVCCSKEIRKNFNVSLSSLGKHNYRTRACWMWYTIIPNQLLSNTCSLINCSN